MKTPTNHFYRLIDAIEHFKMEGISSFETVDKLRRGEIVIGGPTNLKENQYLSSERGRYFIHDVRESDVLFEKSATLYEKFMSGKTYEIGAWAP